jgi:serine protease Do
MNQLIVDGKVHRAALGVSIQDVSLNDAQYVGLPEIRGVVVKDIPSDDSPAKKAGMEPGDIIVAIDGKPVGYVGQLQQEVGFRKPGDVVKVEVARKGGVRKTFQVKLQPLQDAPQLAANPDSNADNDNAGATGSSLMRRMGISVQPVSQQIAQQLQLPADARGLLVTDVTPGGPAWETVLDEGRGGPDIIVAVEGKPVKTEADLRAVLKQQAPGAVVTLRLYNPRLGRRIERVKLADTP